MDIIDNLARLASDQFYTELFLRSKELVEYSQSSDANAKDLSETLMYNAIMSIAEADGMNLDVVDEYFSNLDNLMNLATRINSISE
jgi:hypothetical protein